MQDMLALGQRLFFMEELSVVRVLSSAGVIPGRLPHEGNVLLCKATVLTSLGAFWVVYIQWLLSRFGLTTSIFVKSVPLPGMKPLCITTGCLVTVALRKLGNCVCDRGSDTTSSCPLL